MRNLNLEILRLQVLLQSILLQVLSLQVIAEPLNQIVVVGRISLQTSLLQLRIHEFLHLFGLNVENGLRVLRLQVHSRHSRFRLFV